MPSSSRRSRSRPHALCNRHPCPSTTQTSLRRHAPRKTVHTSMNYGEGTPADTILIPRLTLPCVASWRSGVVAILHLSLIHISEPTRLGMISYAVFCLKKKKKKKKKVFQ